MRVKNNFELVSYVTAKTLSRKKVLSPNLNLLKNDKDKGGKKSIYSQQSFRGLIDFFSFFDRYTINKVYKDFKPRSKDKELLYEFLHLARSHYFAIKEYPGTYKNLKSFCDLVLKKKNINNELFFKNFLNTSLYCCALESFIENKFLNTDIDEIRNFFHRYKNMKDFIILKDKIINHSEYSKFSSVLCDRIIKEKSVKRGKKDSNITNQTNLEKKEKLKKKLYSDSEQIIFDKKKASSTDTSESETNRNINTNKNFRENRYAFFTEKFDQTINAEKICGKSERNALRKKLAEDSPKLDYVVKKLALKLERKLFSKKELSWDFDDYEGLLDTSRFSHIISNPKNEILYKKDKDTAAKNTIVSLLIDNSGSMRGRPIIIAANAVDILVKTLEKCSVKIEILGFTTKEWKGGKSRDLWVKRGRSENPGRLNDLLHIIYKDSERNWKSCEKNLGIVLKDGLLKENIDGEALLWAEKRLLAKNERKKILIVISDGAPVDDSTFSANNSNLLDSHLKEVIKEIEKQKKIDLLAIGIGHDVSKYYKKAITINEVNKLAEVLLTKINLMFNY